jgi:hypothetical protein
MFEDNPKRQNGTLQVLTRSIQNTECHIYDTRPANTENNRPFILPLRVGHWSAPRKSGRFLFADLDFQEN